MSTARQEPGTAPAEGLADAAGTIGHRTISDEVILRAEGISKRFGAVVALERVDLELHRGEVLGLVGDNGAGKSTLVKIITGVFPADGGEILVKGVARSFRSPKS